MTVVVVTPCTGVGRAEIAEARRALAGQGRIARSAADDVVRDLLWLARAVPAALELLAARSLLDVELGRGVVEHLAPLRPKAPLSLVAFRRDDEPLVEVLVIADADLERRVFDAACVRIALPLRIRLPAPDVATDDGRAADDPIRLQRFSFGAAGKTPS